MDRIRKRLSLVIVVLCGLMPAFTVSAQALPATPVAGEAPVGVLAEYEIGNLPAPNAEVWFMRFELDAGGSIPTGSNPGYTILYVERGTLLVDVGSPVVPGVRGAVNTGEMTLEADNSALVPPDVLFEIRNSADGPTTFLMLLMYPALEENRGAYSTDDPVGMSQTGISAGTAEFFPGPATVTLERVVVEPGETMQNVTPPSGRETSGPGWMGIDLGMVETGSAEIELEQQSLNNLIWTTMSTGEMVPPEQILFEASGTIEQGQSYSVFNSVITFTASGDEPLTILRVIVMPETGN